MENNCIKTSGLSIAIKNTLYSFAKEEDLIEKVVPSEFSIKVANTLEEREAVFQLAYRIYLEKGFVKQNAGGKLINSYDADSETLILLVKDRKSNIVGSVTLVFDGSSRLPAEKIFKDELKSLKNNNGKIAEISRLVIDPKYRNSKEILLLLFNYLFIYANKVMKYNYLAIEVNPKHATYYTTLLQFRQIGSERPCPNVEKAPAVLLYIPLEIGVKEVLRESNSLEPVKKNRSLYQYFIKPEQEQLVAFYLRKQFRPISIEEKIYFGFSISGLNSEVCV